MSSHDPKSRETFQQHYYVAAAAQQAEAALTDIFIKSIWEGDYDTAIRLIGEDESRLDQRGKAGETALHICYLHNKPQHRRIAEVILAKRPGIINEVYLCDEYRNENCLHLAIASNDVDLVRYLIRLQPKLVHGRATGHFFAKNGKVYLGELPLSFAAALNRANIATVLVKEGRALINAKDREGNTAAHICAYHDRLDMYLLLNALWSEGFGKPSYLQNVELWQLCNNAGQSPIVVAAARSNAGMFQALWEKRREHMWTWGHVEAYLYPLECIDTLALSLVDHDAGLLTPADEQARAAKLPQRARLQAFLPSKKPRRSTKPDASPGIQDTTTSSTMNHENTNKLSPRAQPEDDFVEWPHVKPAMLQTPESALETIVKGDSESILMLDIMLRLLTAKWDVYGYKLFGLRMAFHICYLVLFTLMAVYRASVSAPRKPFECPANVDVGERDFCDAAVGLEFAVIVATAIKACLGLRRLFNFGFYKYFIAAPGTTKMEHNLSFILYVSVFLAFILDATVGLDASRVPFSIGAIAAWAYMVWFLLGFRITGPFVIILYNMLLGDVIRFLVLLVVVMLGFTQAVVFLRAGNGTQGGDTFGNTLRELINQLLQPELGDPEDDRFLLLPTLAYCFLAPILLLNLLIAQFNGTFTRIMEQCENRWQLERARIIVSLEADLPASIKRSSFCRYWAHDKHDTPCLLHEFNNKHNLETPEVMAEIQACMEQLQAAKSAAVTQTNAPPISLTASSTIPPMLLRAASDAGRNPSLSINTTRQLSVGLEDVQMQLNPLGESTPANDKPNTS